MCLSLLITGRECLGHREIQIKKNQNCKQDVGRNVSLGSSPSGILMTLQQQFGDKQGSC